MYSHTVAGRQACGLQVRPKIGCGTPPNAAWHVLPGMSGLNVEAIDDDALVPGPLHDPGNLHRAFLINHDTNKIEGRVHARAVSPSSDDPQATETHGRAAGKTYPG